MERREGVLDDEYRKANDPRMSGSSVCETERRALFHSIHVRAHIRASIEYMCQDAKRRR